MMRTIARPGTEAETAFASGVDDAGGGVPDQREPASSSALVLTASSLSPRVRGRMAGRRDSGCGNRNHPRRAVSSGAAVDRRHALGVIGEQDRAGWWGRRTDEQSGDGRSAGSPYRTQPEDRRGGFDIGVGIADIQGREDAEGHRQRGSRVMTLQRQPTATGDVSDRLHVEFSRLLCDEGHSASCRDGALKTQDSWGVDRWTATGLDAALPMRQEDPGGARNGCRAKAAAEDLDVEVNLLRYDSGRRRDFRRMER